MFRCEGFVFWHNVSTKLYESLSTGGYWNQSGRHNYKPVSTKLKEKKSEDFLPLGCHC